MNNKQIDILLEYLSTHSELATDGDLGVCGHRKKNLMWKTVAERVSEEGYTKTAAQCIACWNRLKKNAVERKVKLQKKYQQTGNPKITTNDDLTTRDKFILDIWGSKNSKPIPGGTAGFLTKRPSTEDSPSTSKKSRLSKPEKKIETSTSLLNEVVDNAVEGLQASKNLNDILSLSLPSSAKSLATIANFCKKALPILIRNDERNTMMYNDYLLRLSSDRITHQSFPSPNPSRVSSEALRMSSNCFGTQDPTTYLQSESAEEMMECRTWNWRENLRTQHHPFETEGYRVDDSQEEKAHEDDKQYDEEISG
uniref:GT-3A protein n=1 Tax=Fopius arisanus TaxID=64838 RepID=A0A0C9REE5_9HYME